MTPSQDAVDSVNAADSVNTMDSVPASAPKSTPRSPLRLAILRPTIAVFALASLASLVAGVVLFTDAAGTSTQTSTTSDLRTPVTALGLIFVALLAERLAVALAFAHSSRKRGQLSSLLFVLFCLLMMIDSLFFTLRVRGDLHVSWTIAGLPVEEALPPLEVALFAPLALGYAIWPVIRRAGRGMVRLARGGGALVATHGALRGQRRGAGANA